MVFLLLLYPLIFTEPQTLRLELKKVELDAIETSSKLNAYDLHSKSSKARLEASKSHYYPKLSFDASYRYIDKIPKMNIGANTLNFGDNNNYSIGPTLNYTLFDFGLRSNSIKSERFAETAAKRNYLAIKEELILNVRISYYEVLLAIEKMRNTLEALKLAIAQNNDISKRARAGIASNLDAIASNRQVLELKLKLMKAQSDLTAELINLFSLIDYKNFSENLSIAESSFVNDLPSDFEKPNLIISLDNLDTTLNANYVQFKKDVVINNAQLEYLDNLSKSTLYHSKSIFSERLPKIILSGKYSRDYPNGPILDPINQATAAITLSIPLFEAGKASNLSKQAEYEAMAIEEQKNQLNNEMQKEYSKALAKINNLNTQIEIAKIGASDSEKISLLTYNAYKSGTKSFLEVQSRNYETLEWKVQLAVIKTQILMQIALKKNLTEGTFNE